MDTKPSGSAVPYPCLYDVMAAYADWTGGRSLMPTRQPDERDLAAIERRLQTYANLGSADYRHLSLIDLLKFRLGPDNLKRWDKWRDNANPLTYLQYQLDNAIQYFEEDVQRMPKPALPAVPAFTPQFQAPKTSEQPVIPIPLLLPKFRAAARVTPDRDPRHLGYRKLWGLTKWAKARGVDFFAMPHPSDDSLAARIAEADSAIQQACRAGVDRQLTEHCLRSDEVYALLFGALLNDLLFADSLDTALQAIVQAVTNRLTGVDIPITILQDEPEKPRPSQHAIADRLRSMIQEAQDAERRAV